MEQDRSSISAALIFIQDMVEHPEDRDIEDYKFLALAYSVLMLDAHEEIAATRDALDWPMSMIGYRAMLMDVYCPEMGLHLKQEDEEEENE